MSLKRLAALIASVTLLVAAAAAQRNEVSATLGRTFVSSQGIPGADFFDPNVHFGNGLTIGGNYSRFLKRYRAFGISGEVAGTYTPEMKLNLSEGGLIPKSYQSYFITPGVKVNFFPGETLTPWVAIGGGYGGFRMSDKLNFFGSNPGKTSTNTGVFQFGVGVDVWPWQGWGLRMEARDYYSGVPDLNVTTVRSRQHNFYVGGGFIRRF